MLSEKVLQVIRQESIVNYGVHSVAEWESGGSDAVDLCIHTIADFKKEFPNAKENDVIDFFAGERDGFVVDKIADDERDGEIITYTVYYCVSVFDDHICILDADGDIFVERDNGEVDIDTRIANWLDASELEKVCKGLARILSGLDIGESDAWKLICHIESKAVAALQAKSEPSEIPQPDPDITEHERLAGEWNDYVTEVT